MPKPATPLIWASGKSFGFQPSSAQQAQGFDYIASLRPSTGAPITDDHDWPLNQITKAIGWILDSGLGYGSPMIGVPIDWPLSQMPQDIWPDCGMVFLSCAGQGFNKTTYPLAAQLYPSGVMPELRAEFIRGWDNGRGVDPGRGLLSAQGDAIRNITGEVGFIQYVGDTRDSGALYPGGTQYLTQLTPGGSTVAQSIFFDASRAAPTASENRPRSIAFHKIMRVA